MSAVSLQDIILPEEIIIGMLTDRDDLLNCRLVNQHWNYYATKVLSNNQPIVKFSTDNELVGFMDSFLGYDYEAFPFSRYHFRVQVGKPSRHDMSLRSVDLIRMETFFDQYGSHVHHLNLEVGHANGSSSRANAYFGTVRSVFRFLHKVPLLRSLGIHFENTGNLYEECGTKLASFLPTNLVHLHSVRIGAIHESQQWKIPILQQLRASAPNLREVHLCTKNLHPNFDQVLAVFSGLQTFIHGFRIFITNHDVGHIRWENQYKFHELILDLRWIHWPTSPVTYDEYRPKVTHWLENHSNTLEALSINAHEVWDIEIPAMNKLKSLRIFPTGVLPGMVKIRFLPLNPKNFPMLTKVDLQIYRDNYGLFNGDSADSGSFDSVRELVFAYYGDHRYFQFTSDPNHWGKIFPALQTFKFKVNHKDGLRHMMRCMTHVKYLTIADGRSMGYPTPAEDPVHYAQILDGTYVGDAGTSTSLANFSELKTLTIDSDCEYVLEALMNLTGSGALHPLQLISIYKSINITEEDLNFLNSTHLQIKMFAKLPTPDEKFPFSFCHDS